MANAQTKGKGAKDPKKKPATNAATTPQEDGQAVQQATTPQEDGQAVQQATTPQEDDQATQENYVTVSVPDGLKGLNLRDGPGKAFNILDVVPNGAHLAVLLLPEGAEVPGYALVRYEGGKDGPLVGWVNTDFVRED